MADILALSDSALCISVAGPHEAQHLATGLRATGSWLEVVAGIDSVSVLFDPFHEEMSEAHVRFSAQTDAAADTPAARTPETYTIPVQYGGTGGPDLAQICETLGLSEAELVDLHTRLEHCVDMIGFTPGFAYISGLPKTLAIPRLATPRTHVPAGAIGLTTGRTGTYALPGPGGWPLIGQTDTALFDAARAAPFLLHPGDRVRFTAA